jgi:hypothetical protein
MVAVSPAESGNIANSGSKVEMNRWVMLPKRKTPHRSEELNINKPT